MREVNQTTGRPLAERLQAPVHKPAGQIGERNVFRPPALHAAANCPREQWASQGYRVVSRSSETNGEAAWGNFS
jgi:hypothetical protein